MPDGGATMKIPGRMQRAVLAAFDRASADKEKRSIDLSFSSEEPYERWFGIEVLGHRDDECDLGWLNGHTAPLLLDHRSSQQIGVIESAKIENARGRATVRFGNSALAEEVFRDVADGIRANVSVGYEISELQLVGMKDDTEIMRATKWRPLEVSIVSIPADMTVGVGKSRAAEDADDLRDVKVIGRTQQRSTTMPEGTTTSSAPPADMAAARQTWLKEQGETWAAIRDLAARHNMKDLGEKAIAEGRSIEEFRGMVLDKIGTAKPLAPSSEIGLTPKEAQSFSIVRLIAGVIARSQGAKPWVDDSFELSVVQATSDRLMKDGYKPRGFTIPSEVQYLPASLKNEDLSRAQRIFGEIMKRDMIAGSATLGGNIVATNLLSASFIDLLRNAMMVRSMGATVLSGLVGNVAIPKQSGAGTAAWIGEGSAPAESNQQVGQVVLSPRTVAAFTDYSRLLALQSSPAIEQLVRNDLAMILALAIDLACLHGVGGLQPLGIAATSGIGSVAGGTNGAAPTWDNIVDLETQVANVNAMMGSIGYLTNSKVRGKLKRTQKFSGTNGDPIWEVAGVADLPPGFGEMNGYKAGVSNNVSSTLTKGSSSGICSAIFYGNWADLLIGEWGVLDLLIDPYTQSTSMNVRVVAHQTVDAALRRVESFSAMLDALTT